MSAEKQMVRERFRTAVFRRAKYRCQGPGCKVVATAETAETILDAHHVTPRELMPGGGYVAENGVCLCKADCHEKAEQNLRGGDWPGFASDDLYKIIGSNRKKAEAASKRLIKTSPTM